MADPWLSIVGLGEDGLNGLPNASRAALEEAEVIFGGARHLELAGAGTRGQAWPVPFDLAPVLACRGQKVVVLASGDPFWFGAGGSLAAHLSPGEWCAFPVAGIVSLACARLGWRIEEVTALGLHAAGFGALRRALHPGAKVIATLRDADTPRALADWLVAEGFGTVQMHVLERMGGPHQRVRMRRAESFDLTSMTAPVAVALDGADLSRNAGLPHVPGLPEDRFTHDGQITKSPIRALTLATLAPRPGALLWDIGGGSGSISVEWGLAGGRAITIEPRPDRIANIQSNIEAFGLTRQIRAIEGRAPEVLGDLPSPEAVFIGGGSTEALYDWLWAHLPGGTRIVANAVTLETEAILAGLHARHGGSLMRIDLSRAEGLGRMRGWSAARPVVQWSVTR
ncbi:precorrin-6y C5,15-methyltransferase (decarboxylating) subunit CbiE [Celeribacter neptunius]|uniref:Precorrin-6Y C5,15-methyltransferase (Decarboxylating) n=1 Tax=Celeribacter neptunius TaxID=588602 RepID=A0A1I3PQT0_9RHOB|nr:precorrin-6y C5,15-methyltransferase (decarboxylating) subunit CbiE [Celeribacter neptunius]SFJ23823.1 precorrin-6Y C5,15-methyltransferase (decarboxylating) [Celeribacter neptunius]